MSLWEQVETDLKVAMRAKDELARDTLRMVLADLKNKRIALGEDLDDNAELGVLKRAVKTRIESAEVYEKADRQDLAKKERAEIAVLEGYLPKMLSEDETRTLVEKTVAELGISSKKDMGSLMKALMARHKSEVDGKTVQKVAGEFLS
jgi:hypothetical protein